MQINPPPNTATTTEARIAEATRQIRREAELQGELAATERWIKKLEKRKTEISSELAIIRRQRLLNL